MQIRRWSDEVMYDPDWVDPETDESPMDPYLDEFEEMGKEADKVEKQLFFSYDEEYERPNKRRR